MNRTNSLPVEQGHEPNVVNVRVLMLAAVGLVLLVAFVLLLMGGTMRLLTRQEPAQGASTPGLRSAPTATGPLVSAEQPQLLDELRRSEQRRLTSYEWVDESAGVARIPIARAMEQLARNGLPTSQPASEGEHDNASN